MPVLFPRREVFSRRPLREFNKNHEPKGTADRDGDGKGDGGRFAKGDGADSGGTGTPAAAPSGTARPQKANPKRHWPRGSWTAKPGQQPFEANNAVTTLPSLETKAAFKHIASTLPAEEVPAALFAHLQQHEPAIVEAAAQLHLSAKVAEGEFESAMQTIAQTLGIEVTTENIESEAFLAKDTQAIALGPIKNVDRTAVKATSDYDGNVLKVKDMLRSSIVVNDVAGMADALTKLREVMDISLKDNVSTPAPGGWRAYNVIARLKKSGMLAEVQITTRNMLRAKHEAHPIYKKSRVIPETHPEYPALLQQQESIYNRAWAASGSASAAAAIAFIAALAPSLRGV